jgi:hypothetical protein
MTDTNNSPLEGNVLFYTKPEPLDPTLHGALGVNAADKPYAFVGQTNIVPLTVTEFAAAALSYPVIFTGENRQPVVVMGLRQGENLFVETGASGPAQQATPGLNGLGLLQQGSLESSNVNVVEELVSMIETQRAYEMNAKAVSTTDGMLAYLNNNL